MLMTLVSHTTNKEAGEHLTRCRVKKKESPSCSIKAPFSHSLFRRKEIMMNTHISTQEQDEMTVRPDAMVTDLEGLAAGGFTSEEIVSLLWLRQRYQTGAVTALCWCAAGSSSSSSFLLASWTCKKASLSLPGGRRKRHEQ